LLNRFAKKSPVYIAITGLLGFSILGLGVGGTLAATGVIPNPFVSSTSVESAPETETGSSDQGRIPIGDGTLPSDVGEWGAMGCFSRVDEEVNCQYPTNSEELARRGSALIQSGWTGTVYNFTKSGFYSQTLVNVSFPDNVTSKVEVNGRLLASSTIHDCKPIAPERWKADWNGHCSTMINMPFNQKEFLLTYFALCQSGGDTYVVEASGGGYIFRESGTIPAEVFDCPPAVLTPSPTPESSSEPITSPTPTPESSNESSNESSSEPESSPTPTP
jgi:hypothetical protein